MTQDRPFGVTLLSLLAWVQAAIAGYHALQYLHVLPISLGQFSFYGFDPLGAALWGATAAIYIWAARLLWRLDVRGWMFAAFMAGWMLVLDVISLIGATSLEALLPSILVSAAVLIYCLLPSTRGAFLAARS